MRQGVDHDKDHAWTDDAWYLGMGTGNLWGNEKTGSDGQGKDSIKVGDRVGVLIDTEGEGRVLFFKNGKKFGPGFSGGVTGKLLLGVQTHNEGCQCTLLPGAEEPAELDTGCWFMEYGSHSNISLPESLTVTQQGVGHSLATCGIVVGGDGCRRFSFELLIDSGHIDIGLNCFFIGAVRQGVDHNKTHFTSNDAWYLNMGYGSLYGNGKRGSDEQGDDTIKVGDRVGVLIDTEGEGRVLFFKNSQQYGPGFVGGVSGRLVLGVQTLQKGCQVTLLPDAEEPAEPFTKWEDEE